MSKTLISAVFCAAALLVQVPAQADKGGRALATNPLWKAECGTCHTAFPAEFMGPKSWTTVMSQLKQHYGVDASLEPAQQQEILQFLLANAKGKRAQEAPKNPPKLTETAWFIRKHDEVPARAWSNPKVKSASNCAACHSGADQGNFDEDAVRIPR